jgi:hypothetical protein
MPHNHPLPAELLKNNTLLVPHKADQQFNFVAQLLRYAAAAQHFSVVVVRPLVLRGVSLCLSGEKVFSGNSP